MSTYEIETKYRVVDPQRIEGLFAERASRLSEAVRQADHYLAHPSRDFAQTGEALRIRLDGESLRITYKGQKLKGPAKTREEIELEVGGGSESLPALARFFEALGFKPVAIVRKRRSGFELAVDGLHFHLALDEVDELGTFAEVETIAEGTEALEQAQAAVVKLAASFGLTEPEPRSYLRMLLESRGTSR